MPISKVKYSRLTNIGDAKDAAFDFTSAFSYNEEGGGEYAKHDFGSVFKYRDPCVKVRIDDEGALNHTAKPSVFLKATSWTLTVLSYFFFLLTIPISYWFFVKKMGEFERLVIFRLGKMIGVKGPGRFVVFPWMDRIKRIDVRASAFSVPPQQFITVDGGIVEMGAEIQYGIVDVVTMISEVADHQDILRSLGKTLLIKILVKKTITQLQRDKRMGAQEIMDEINDQVRKWGINVQNVTLSEPKILKQADSGSNTAVSSIMKGLGVKGEPKYPSPQEFVRVSHGLEEAQQDTFSATSLLGATGLGGGGGGPSASMNMSMLQSLTQGGSVSSNMGMVSQPTEAKVEELPANWGRCLEVIINNEFGVIEDDAHGVYELEITDTESGKDVYFIELSVEKRSVSTENTSGKRPDVSVSISSPDLGNVLDGSLAPLQAYLTGRITANGDVRKLMFFDKLSRRGHKPGSMFSV